MSEVRLIPREKVAEAQSAAASEFTSMLATRRHQHVDRRDARKWWPLAFAGPSRRDGDPFGAVANIRSWTEQVME
jgi:hypothetical protein